MRTYITVAVGVPGLVVVADLPGHARLDTVRACTRPTEDDRTKPLNLLPADRWPARTAQRVLIPAYPVATSRRSRARRWLPGPDFSGGAGHVPALGVVTRSRSHARGSYACCRWRAVRVRRAESDDDPIRAPRPASAPRALWFLRCRDAWCAGDGGPGTRDRWSGDPCGS
jgi:hypothetical protein